MKATAALVGLVVTLLAACGSDGEAIGIASHGSIRGIVTDSTGATLSNVAVALTGIGEAARTTNTGAGGVYTFADVPPGTYVLAVTPPPGFTAGSAVTASVTVARGAQADATALVLNRMGPDEAFVAALHARLESATITDAFSGAVLVVRGDSTVFEGAYGLADRERAIPNSPLTQFRVGSMNKMLTAVSVLQLVQAGKVRLDVPLGTYLTDYPNADMASTVTLHHLLTHTGGTGDIFGPQFNAHRLELRDTDDYLRLYGGRGLQFAPGSQWGYSNYGFMLLGAVIERVSGMRYDDYVEKNVLAPAGMTSTGAAPEDSLVPGRAVGYMLSGGVLVSNAPTLPYRGTPAGGWYSTVGDFERFAVALRQHRLLDAAHTALLLDGKVMMGQSVVQYAYGFMNRVQVGRRLVGHGGSAPGMSGELSFEPNGGYTVVVLSNFSPPAAALIEAFILNSMPK
jgi:D-alanyl-D-alanine carboxypeptidase